MAVNPPVIVVMGVSGSGKTTIGTRLAHRLGVPYAEADDFHPKANIEKMAAGQPLTDEDRMPWLAAIGAWIDLREQGNQGGVVTCSALKRTYRDTLRHGRPDVRLVYLKISPELAAARLAHRHGHFFPPNLLGSQFQALAEPEPDEGAITISVEPSPDEVIDKILSSLGIAAA